MDDEAGSDPFGPRLVAVLAREAGRRAWHAVIAQAATPPAFWLDEAAPAEDRLEMDAAGGVYPVRVARFGVVVRGPGDVELFIGSGAGVTLRYAVRRDDSPDRDAPDGGQREAVDDLSEWLDAVLDGRVTERQRVRDGVVVATRVAVTWRDGTTTCVYSPASPAELAAERTATRRFAPYAQPAG